MAASHAPGRASIAWVFFMIFALSMRFVIDGCWRAGWPGFEDAVILAVSCHRRRAGALIAAARRFSYQRCRTPPKLMHCGAMVLGRLETLAIIALLNPIFGAPRRDLPLKTLILPGIHWREKGILSMHGHARRV